MPMAADSVDCPHCSREKDCKNDLLFHIIRDHDADMSGWPGPGD